MMNNIYSTQERAFTFVGLGKAARIAALGDVSVDIVDGGKVLGSTDGKDLIVNIDNSHKSVSLKTKGQGEIYYFLNTEGVKTGEVKESDSKMWVRRNYIDFRTGKTITSNKFSQGQLVVCEIILTGKENSAKNIAVTDLIPSGFEIENPRLSPSAELQNYTSTMNVQYMDIRDDRLILFTDLPYNNSVKFYYMLRAVNKGRFYQPVIGAEAMYDPEFNSTNGKAWIRIY
jgi:hypothetical protein